VITTVLYFVVFGAAIGGRIGEVDGVTYGAFIVPGLIMLTVFTESLSNASFGIHMPKFTGTIYELLSAPVSAVEIVLGYVGAAATKSVVLGLVILLTASLFVPIQLLHPGWMLFYLVLVAVAFSLAGFIIGIWARGFEELHFVPMLIVTPLTFLGGAFYSIDMLPGYLAHGEPVQSGGLRGERLPLELLRQRRRVHGHQPGGGGRPDCTRARVRVVDLPHGLPAQAVSPGPVSRAQRPGWPRLTSPGCDAATRSFRRRRCVPADNPGA
jgi:hypothetical protein